MPEDPDQSPQAQPSLVYSPAHQQAVGRVVLAASAMEGVLGTILSRLWEPPEDALRRYARPWVDLHTWHPRERWASRLTCGNAHFNGLGVRRGAGGRGTLQQGFMVQNSNRLSCAPSWPPMLLGGGR
jgi:hypothetical protein